MKLWRRLSLVLALAAWATCATNRAWAAWPLGNWFSSNDSAGKQPANKTTARKPVAGKASGEKSGTTSGIGRVFGTHKIANGAKSMFTPKKQAASKSRTSSSGTASKAAYNKKADEKPSFLKSLFVQEEPPPPQSIGEFMALKRPLPKLDQ